MSLNLEHLASRDSLLARRDPRWRLVSFALAISSAAVIHRAGPAAVALVAAWLLAFAAHVPGRWYGQRIGLLMIALIPFLLVVPFTVDRGERLWEWQSLSITDTGLLVAATLAMKTIAIVTLALTFLSTAPLPVTMAAACRIGVPKLLVHLTLLTYRYVFLLLEELNRLRIALRVRGFRNAMTGHAYRTIGQVAGTLIVRGSDRADHVADAMRCRGFDGRFRTLVRFQSKPADVWMFVAIVGVFSGLVCWDVLG